MEEISLTEIKDGMEQLSNQLAELTDTVKKLGVQLDRIVSTNGMQQLGGASFGGPQVLQPSANNYPQMPVNQPVYMQVPANNHLMYASLPQQQMFAFQSSPARGCFPANQFQVFQHPQQGQFIQSAQPVSQPSMPITVAQPVQQPEEAIPNVPQVQQNEQVTQAAQPEQPEQAVNQNNEPAACALNSSASQLDNQEESISSTHKVKEEINNSPLRASNGTAEEAGKTAPSTSANASLNGSANQQLAQNGLPSSSNDQLVRVKSEEYDSDLEIVFEAKKSTSRRSSSIGSKKSRVLLRKCYFKNCSSEEGFPSRDHLSEHFKKKHNGHKIICFALPDCFASFNTSEELLNHVKAAHSNLKKFSCSNCNFELSEYTAFSKHYFSNHLSGQYQCANCDFKAEYVNVIFQHFDETHQDMDDQNGGRAVKKLRT